MHYSTSTSQREFIIFSLACRCFTEAKKRGYSYFAIRYWGECVAGGQDAKLAALIKSGDGISNNCANVNFGECTDHNGESECAGRANAEYMYSVTSGTEGMFYSV